MSRRLAALASVAVMAVSGLAATGCGSPRNSLGTTSSPCFRAVPVASEAVKDRGKLAGVRLVGPKTIDAYPRLRAVVQRRAGSHIRSVCVVSFHGQFRLDQVRDPIGHAPPGGTGIVALVLVSSPQNRLLGTLVLEHEPLPLRHEVLGVG
ncbi:MAG: hypothetical protein ACYDA2_00480 [Acidimicrobiales bacterium]